MEALRLIKSEDQSWNFENRTQKLCDQHESSVLSGGMTVIQETNF
jgi:hypothetical protein